MYKVDIFNKIHRYSSSKLIIEELLKVIQSNEFRVGDRLPSERNLAKQLGVSRPTLREATSALAILDVLEIRQGSGTYVKATNVDDNLVVKAEELVSSEESPLQAIEMLILVEPGIAGLAAERAEDADLAEMRKALDEIKNSVKTNETFRISGLNFHLAVVHSIHNIIVEHACLIPLTIRYSESSPWWNPVKAKLIKPGRLAASYDYLERVYQAIKEGDSNLASTVMLSYLISAKDDLLSS